MRIKFAVDIKQVDRDSIEIVNDPRCASEVLVDVCFGETVRKILTEDQMNKIQRSAEIETIRQSIQIVD